jgi:hypothetical protein
MQDTRSSYIAWESTREQDERVAREKAEQARLVGAVEGLAKTKDGIHFLHWLMERSGFLGGVPVLPHESMAYMEGQRSVGQAVFDLVKRAHCVEAVCQEDIDG